MPDARRTISHRCDVLALARANWARPGASPKLLTVDEALAAPVHNGREVTPCARPGAEGRRAACSERLAETMSIVSARRFAPRRALSRFNPLRTPKRPAIS